MAQIVLSPDQPNYEIPNEVFLPVMQQVGDPGIAASIFQAGIYAMHGDASKLQSLVQQVRGRPDLQPVLPALRGVMLQMNQAAQPAPAPTAALPAPAALPSPPPTGSAGAGSPLAMLMARGANPPLPSLRPPSTRTLAGLPPRLGFGGLGS